MQVGRAAANGRVQGGRQFRARPVVNMRGLRQLAFAEINVRLSN
jgi:hypothetical protein